MCSFLQTQMQLPAVLARWHHCRLAQSKVFFLSQRRQSRARKEVQCPPSTRRSAESHLRRHVLLLGGCPLEDLTVKQMQTFVTTLASGQRTAKTIENVLLTLSSILGAARKWATKCRWFESLTFHCLESRKRGRGSIRQARWHESSRKAHPGKTGQRSDPGFLWVKTGQRGDPRL